MSNLVLWFKHTNFVWNKFGCKEISLRKNNLFCPQGIISMIYKKKGNGIGSGVGGIRTIFNEILTVFKEILFANFNEI